MHQSTHGRTICSVGSPWTPKSSGALYPTPLVFNVTSGDDMISTSDLIQDGAPNVVFGITSGALGPRLLVWR